METTNLTVAQALVRFLDQVYLKVDDKETKFVHGIAAIFGHGNVLGLGEALALEKHHLKVYQGKSEQGMAQLAIAYAKQKNRQAIIACSSSVGPGAANMLTAAALATTNHLPLLLFPGDTFASRRPDPVLQQIENTSDFNVTTNDAFKPLSRYWDRIMRPEQLINSLLWAFEVLTNPALVGAVTISLPQDIQAQAYDWPNWFFEKRVYTLKRPWPERKVLNKALELIKKARQPLIIVGGGARYSEASCAISQLSRLVKAPLAFTQAGKSTVSFKHPYYLGGLGITGNWSANLYAQKADLIIGIGTRYTDFTTASKIQFLAEAQFINININHFDANKMRALAIVADAKATVQSLVNLIKRQKFNFQGSLALIEELQAKWKQEKKRLVSLPNEAILKTPHIEDEAHFLPLAWKEAIASHYKKPLEIFSQVRALDLIQKHIDPRASIVAASGSIPGDLQRLWEAKVINTYNVEYGYSCMGHELSGAVGAAIANPHGAYALLGDGSFVMLHSELLTALQEKIPVVFIVMDNGGFSVINNLQVGHLLPSFETQFHHKNSDSQKGPLMVVDYAQIARGYGLEAKLVSSEKELISVLKYSQKITKPLLIEIKVYPKSMSHGYATKWQVGLAEKSKEAAVVNLAKSENLIWQKRNERN